VREREFTYAAKSLRMCNDARLWRFSRLILGAGDVFHERDELYAEGCDAVTTVYKIVSRQVGSILAGHFCTAEDRIRDLCAQLLTTEGDDEIQKLVLQLKAAIHEHCENLKCWRRSHTPGQIEISEHVSIHRFPNPLEIRFAPIRN